MSDARLLVEISGHGYGHLAQTGPVLNALRRGRPGLDLVVRSAIPHGILASRIEGRFELIRAITDPGLEMSSAVHVERAAYHAAYRRFHLDWATLASGHFEGALRGLLARPLRPPPRPEGVQAACRYLPGWLASSQ